MNSRWLRCSCRATLADQVEPLLLTRPGEGQRAEFVEVDDVQPGDSTPSGPRPRTLCLRYTRARAIGFAIALIALLLLGDHRAFAAVSLRRWDPAATPNYPIIKVYTCMTQVLDELQLSPYLLEYAIAYAVNEWFTGSGADLRMIYKGSLLPSHPACNEYATLQSRQVSPVPSGAIVITAVKDIQVISQTDLSTSNCSPVLTQQWYKRPTPLSLYELIYAARVVLIREENCSSNSPTMFNWTLAESLSPPIGAYDLGTTLLRELGRAIGLPATNNPDSILSGELSAYPSLRRHVLPQDIMNMRDTYGITKSRPVHTVSVNGNVYLPRQYQPEPINIPSVGQAGCYQLHPHFPQMPFLVATTEVDDSQTGIVSTYVMDETGSFPTAYLRHGSSNLSPSVACGRSENLLAFVEQDHSVVVKRSTDIETWENVSLPDRLLSGVPVTLVFVPWNGYYMLVVANPDSGAITVLASSDSGHSFKIWWQTGRKSFVPVGLLCASASQECLLVGDRNHADFFRFRADGKMDGLGSPGPYKQSLGDSLASSGDKAGDQLIHLTVRNELSRSHVRTVDSYQEAAGTSLEDGRIPYGDSDRADDWRRPVSDSLPSVAWDGARGFWVVWYTYSGRYTAEYSLYPHMQ